MTQEEIQQKAYETYPIKQPLDVYLGSERVDYNKEKREGYIKALTEYDLALTPEKIKSILEIASTMDEEIKNSGFFPPEWSSTEKYYDELLKRFNQLEQNK